MRLLAINLVSTTSEILQYSKKNIASENSRKRRFNKNFKRCFKNVSIQFFKNGGKPPYPPLFNYNNCIN